MLRSFSARKEFETRPRLALWVLSAPIGLAVGYGVIGLITAINGISGFAFGGGEEEIAEAGRQLPFLRIWIVPILGGVAVGALLWAARKQGWLPDARAHGVADAIEARAVKGGAVDMPGALASSAIAAVSLGAGASAGREGPAVHLGAAVGSFAARRFGFQKAEVRTLLACGAAAAVSASFNAPIAGVLFALEVVLGHYALSVFGPVTIASVAAALVSRAHLGDFPAFFIPYYGDAGIADAPIALGLGILCGLAASGFMASVRTGSVMAERMRGRLSLPVEAMPVLGGVLIGLIGAGIPEILGVGYEAIDAALSNSITILLAMVLLALKIIATSITLSCRFGGGVFSPGLFIGAMTGVAFGIGLEDIAPGVFASPSYFAIVGMGAAAGAVLGAPISTTLIVFELTGDYQMTISLLVAVSAATVVTQRAFGRSFFHWQLVERGYDLSEGPHGVILDTIRVRDVMATMPEGDEPLPEDAVRLYADQTLGEALAFIEEAEEDGLPVVARDAPDAAVGYLSQYRALKSYNKALIDAHIEEHR